MAPSKNRMIKPFISVRTASWEQTISLYIKKTFYIVYREEKSFGLCSHRLFPFLFPYPNRPLSAMYGLCFPPGSQQFFFLNKGKGIGSQRPLSGAEGSTSLHLPRRPMGESFWGERQRRWGDDNAPQGGPGVPPWRIFGDFLFEKKVTRGGGAERPPHGGCGGA